MWTLKTTFPLSADAPGAAVPVIEPPLSSAEHAGAWPAVPPEADLVISAMEAGRHQHLNRRALRRISWRVQGVLRLFIDTPGVAPRIVYTRDVHARSLGFITRQRLPLGYGGVVDLPGQDGLLISISCTLLRCRLATPGWYEGVVYFNREQLGMEKLLG